MKKQDEARTAIINAAQALIETSDGNVQEITTRMIAEKANVGIGLINYHFQTKERLIELCVQNMIHHVTGEFEPKLEQNASDERLLLDNLKLVGDFLAGNPSVSQISIIGDLSKPSKDDNTMRTVSGLNRLLGEKNEGYTSEQKLKIFALVSTMQTAFLRRDLTGELLGFDFNVKEERDLFLEILVKQVIGGTNDK